MSIRQEENSEMDDYAMQEDTMEDGTRIAVPSPYDSQQPSTSSSNYASPCWVPTPSPFGTLPTPQTPAKQQPAYEAPTGGRTMRKAMAAYQLANTADWIGAQYKTEAPMIPSSPLRTPSMASVLSGVTDISGMTGFTDMTGLTIQTNFNEVDLNVRELRQMHNKLATVKQEPDENPTMKEWVLSDQMRAFNCMAVQNNTVDYKALRCMALKLWTKEDPVYNVTRKTKLEELANYQPETMYSIIFIIANNLLEESSNEEQQKSLTCLFTIVRGARNHFIQFIYRQPEFLDCLFNFVDPRGNANCSVAAMKIIHSILLSNIELKRKCRERKEYIKIFLDYVLNSTDLLYKRRYMAIDTLRLFMKPTTFMELGGIEKYVEFLDKNRDESANGNDKPRFMLLKVEKHEEVLAAVVLTLRRLVTDSKEQNRKRSIDHLVKCDGIQILSSWLDHGSPRLLKNIAECLAYAAKSSRGLERLDLREPVRAIVAFIGFDISTIGTNLLECLNILVSYPIHKKAAIEAEACKELIQLLNFWSQALISTTGFAHPHAPMIQRVLHYGLIILQQLTENEAIDTGRYNSQNIALIQLRGHVDTTRVLLQMLTQEFMYKACPVAPHLSKNDAHQAVFQQRYSPDQKLDEICSKALAVKLLLRIISFSNSEKLIEELVYYKDSIHEEPLVVMLWRRLWEMYAIVLSHAYQERVHWEQRRTKMQESEPYIQPALGLTIDTTRLLNILYNDDRHFTQAVRLWCVPLSVEQGYAPPTNPLRMIIAESETFPSLFFNSYCSHLLLHFDHFLFKFSLSCHSKAFQYPLASWLIKRDEIDYSKHFQYALHQARSSSFLKDDVVQSLIEAFNHVMGTPSPLMTPSYPPINGYGHPAMGAVHRR